MNTNYRLSLSDISDRETWRIQKVKGKGCWWRKCTRVAGTLKAVGWLFMPENTSAGDRSEPAEVKYLQPVKTLLWLAIAIATGCMIGQL